MPGVWRRHAGVLAEAEFAGLYFLLWQVARHGTGFAARRRKSDPRPDAAACLALLARPAGEGLREDLLAVFERYQFRGVIANVPAALAQWLRGAWPLMLRFDIPPPQEVLRLQAAGIRPVTALTAPARLCGPVLHKPDAFAFFIHDLEHAWKFFFSPELHAGQRAFFARLAAACGDGVFAPCLAEAEFTARFQYLMSDMNTHPEHSRQYLRAILVEWHLRREGKTPAEALSAAAERAVDEVMRTLPRETASA
ncbi:MAG: hypothetical protein IPK65_10815 [Gammaproteobacteria bacterium]|nr:hypothetical protein [Gammaproteobacteria bacterium]